MSCLDSKLPGFRIQAIDNIKPASISALPRHTSFLHLSSLSLCSLCPTPPPPSLSSALPPFSRLVFPPFACCSPLHSPHSFHEGKETKEREVDNNDKGTEGKRRRRRGGAGTENDEGDGRG